MQRFPNLQNSTGHLILRQANQWSNVLPPTMALTFTRNAKSGLFPDYKFVAARADKCMSGLQDLSLPVYFETEGCFTDHIIATPEKISVLVADATEVSWQTIENEMATHPHLSAKFVHNAVLLLKSRGLRLGQWDKALHRVAGFCRHIDDR